MRFPLTLALLLVTSILSAQGTIRGKLTDGQNGEVLIGANVVIQDPYRGVMCDLDGNYSIENLPYGTYDLVGSFIGYTAQSIQVTVQDDEVIIQNFQLFPATYVIEEAAEVIAKVDRSRDVYMENIKKKNGYWLLLFHLHLYFF